MEIRSVRLGPWAQVLSKQDDVHHVLLYSCILVMYVSGHRMKSPAAGSYECPSGPDAHQRPLCFSVYLSMYSMYIDTSILAACEW